MVLTLFFAIALGPRLAPILAGGVAGGTLLLTLIFRTLKNNEDRKNKAVPQETSPEGEKALEPEPISYRADVEIIGDSPEVISEQTNWDALRDSISLQPPEAIKTLETSAVKEKELRPGRGILERTGTNSNPGKRDDVGRKIHQPGKYASISER